ncbi:MAG: GNAT family N-acetyltransferase [Actinomycetota bacterium]|nr:GNAT family N-acetyltransferase [Actinomycetota bacterium]
MTLGLVPLSMSTIGAIPQPCRSCVFWELDPAAAEIAEREGHSAFEKEVWLSGVMLTWGSAGLIVTVDDEPAGYALFAPPTTVPGVAVFPSGPVSPDAVLLTTARIDTRFAGRGLGSYLLTGVVQALTRRGVRAIEMFGREGRPAAGPTRGEATGSSRKHCTLPADFARAAGFVEVKPHRKYPRLRYELSGELGWKAEVEAALERLVELLPVGAGPDPVLAVVASASRARPAVAG